MSYSNMNEQRKEIEDISAFFLKKLKEIIPKKLYALYIYGAAAFPDDLPTGDVDFMVILTEGNTPEEKDILEKTHKEIGEKFPGLGQEMDGHYITLEDAKGVVPPRSHMWKLAVDESWALHREHILSGRFIKLFGPDPVEILKRPTKEELDYALNIELDYVKEHLQQYPDYCILNLTRLIYSHLTGDVVVSKDKASLWGLKKLPEWKDLIGLARKSYQGKGTQEEKDEMLSKVMEYLQYALERTGEK